jgi:hypothetical protein
VEVLEVGGGRNNGTMTRDEFEKSSRMKRFNFYKSYYEKHMNTRISSSLSLSSGGGGGGGDVQMDQLTSLGEGGNNGVMLAHHLGDVEENVLSNVLHGCMPDKLSGMKEVGSVEGVNVWRPLLPWRKDEILRFAHKYGVFTQLYILFDILKEKKRKKTQFFFCVLFEDYNSYHCLISSVTYMLHFICYPPTPLFIDSLFP